MARLLVLMGSGETTPTMVTPHQRFLAAVGDGAAVMLDTPYGFQENADELSARTLEYFEHNVGRRVEVVSLRDAATLGAIEREVATARVREAAWVFAGPGSPSYLARQWLATAVPAALVARLTDTARSTVSVFASAAACTVGRATIPVYELYKVGEAPHWQPGLDLLRPLGLDAIVVPHYDNAEGGTHDTSCCYIGERRLRILEAELDPTTWVLGVDEHTAAVIDLEADDLRVEGRGRVVVRLRDERHEFASGTTVPLSEVRELVAAWTVRAHGAASTDVSTHAGIEQAAAASSAATAPTDGFDAALAAGDVLAAAEVTAAIVGRAVSDTAAGSDDAGEAVRQLTAIARIAQAGLHEHRALVAPHVETLLALREQARSERRFGDADAIRDALIAAGVEVHDARDGTGWDFHDPLEDALGA
jgi:hypothetical protein